MATKRREDLLAAAKTYEDYCLFIQISKFRSDMLINLAESYFHGDMKVRVRAKLSKVGSLKK